LRRQVANVRHACEEHGRDPGSLVMSVALCAVCGTDDTEVARRATAIGRTVEFAREVGPTGTPAEVMERLAADREAGAERAYLQLLDVDDLDRVRLIAAEVLPELR
jgi:alkanesulfonate monooxygenase SsuD/methylene tetrahydromethanopterin reductase-like flavin-dependent oxidoreductase (luciferase family)